MTSTPVPSQPVQQFPLSLTERAHWFLHGLAPGGSAYNLAIAAWILSPLDVMGLGRALQGLVDRHALLRATFTVEDGEPVHRIPAHTPVSFEVIDTSQCTEDALRRRVQSEVYRPFDLAHGPLFRATLFRCAPERAALLLSAHHIVTDMGSFAILLDELRALYAAEVSGDGAALPEVPMAYEAYVRWQQALLGGPEGERMKAYWKEQLGGELPVMSLPLDRPRPPVQSDCGTSYSFRLPAQMPRRLRGFAKQHGVTPFMTLLAAFEGLLHRYTGQDDLLVGSPVGGRRGEAAFASMVGNFVNMLVLRADLSGEPTFAELLERTRQTVNAAREHQEYPFPLLVEQMQPVRDPSRSPLFQVMFSLQRLPQHEELSSVFAPMEVEERIAFGPLTLAPLAVSQQEGQMDLALDLFEIGGELYADLKYSTDLFEAATVERIARHYVAFLEGALAQPGQRVDAIQLLGEAERRKILVDWNDTREEVRSDVCFHALFEAQVERAPDSVAVVFQGEATTYGSLNRRANALGHALRAAGVARDQVVGLLMHRGVGLLASILGAFKAGGAYLPLDPEHPAPRLRQVLESSRARVVLVTRALENALAGALEGMPAAQRPAVLLVDEAGRGQPEVNLPPAAGPGDLAYVIYTSGSTGAPKGAMLEHRGMLNHLHAKVIDLGIGASDRVAQNASQCFDISVWQHLVALLVGGEVHIAEDEIAADPRRLLAWTEERGVTVLEVVPSLLRMMLAEIEGAADSGEGAGGTAWERPSLKALRWIVPTGEALPPELCRAWLRAYPTIPLMNAYGPTECSDDVAHYPVHTAPGTAMVTTPIGRPVANMRLYVLDRCREPMPEGVAGEIYVGGVGVGRGYLNDPERSAAAFVADPFSGDPEAKLYRTGDLGRWLPDGTLEFLGRLDHQVKIRGFRIELGEIEAVLGTHPAVRQALVVAREDTPGDVRLVAYVVPAGVPAPGIAGELRGFVVERLPRYMEPAAVVVLGEMPLTRNGKIDRQALPVPEFSRSGPRAGGKEEDEETFVAPRSALEEQLAEVWRTTLGASRVGVHDNFFELGGHSLLAMQLVARMRKTLGVELPLRAIFDAPTVAMQAEVVAARGAHAGGSAGHAGHAQPVLRPDPARRHEPFPLTDLQQAYWLGQTGALGGRTAALAYLEVEIQDLDLARFNRALGRLIARHDMLRAVVRPDGQQEVRPEVPTLELEVADLRRAAPGEVEQILEGVRRDLSRVARHAEAWPLLRMRAHRLTDRATRLHLSYPLLLGDERSYQILNDDLERFYEDPDAALPPLTLSFRDHVMSLAALQSSAAIRRSEDYWRSRLQVLPAAPQLPLTRASATPEGARFSRRSGRLPAEAWQRLKARITGAGLSATAALCAVYADVLARWSSSPHFTLNVLFQDRPEGHPEIQEVLGNFNTTILLEVDQREREAFLGRARRVQAQLWSDMEHSQVSGVRVIRELARSRGGSAGATMPVVFASDLNIGPGRCGSRELLGTLVERRLQTPHVWLDHQVFEEGDTLGFNWDAVEEVFPEGVLDAMVEAYAGHLARLADGEGWDVVAEMPLAEAQLAARKALNATDAPESKARLHGLFEAQARRTPEAAAVIDPRRTLSYAELAGWTRGLGRALQELGARPNRLVAIVMEKGFEQVVAALAILHAGAAYLPIDPALPAERLRLLLEHGEVEVALTQPWLEARLDWPEGVRRVVVDEPLTTDDADDADDANDADDADDDADADEAALAPAQQPGDLAYVIFTSGSTGLPKGVMIDHRGAVNTVLDVNERFGVGPSDRVLALSSLSFDLSVYDVFGLLAAGGAVVLPDRAAARSPAHWADLVVRQRVTLWNTVPALMQLFVEHVSQAEGAPRLPLRTVMLSGDWIPVALPERIQALVPQARVVSLGGATEASIWSILFPIDRVDPAWQSIPYGRPMKNQRFHVLEGALAPRPVWATGELYIAGVGLSLGYWRDPEKTAARFVTHPGTGERLYRTGDLGRYLPSGDIEFLGREDFQVKIQGYRIELGEIETALDQHPALRASVVTALGDARGEKRLVAYVVPRADLPEGEEPTPARLRAFLQEKLPEYMVPSTFVTLGTLPLTPNGKVNRTALPDPGSAHGSRRTTDFVAPRDTLEMSLAQLWEELLDARPVGMRDSFFDLGGNSFAAVRLIAQLKRTFGVDLRLGTLLESPTVEGLAAVLRQHRAAVTSTSPLVPLKRGGEKAPFFCVHPVGGNVFCYVELARRLGSDRAFYGIQASAGGQAGSPAASLQAMATRYVAALREVQPRGPYALGGWSMGGVVAFEMAQQLRAMGEEVSLLALLDSRVPAPRALEEAQLLAWFLRDLGGTSGRPIATDVEALRQLAPGAQLRQALAQAHAADALPRDIGVEDLERLYGVFRDNMRAMLAYTPGPYAGPVTLLHASEPVPGDLEAAHEPAGGWSAFCAAAPEVHEVPGDHYTMFTAPRLDVLASRLEGCLARVP
ncbi:amino acid adenylation domain-containing protein [Chondromyces apiculatus]|uniref:L-cysteine--[L-cysteinyl-carrier protein] ligase n=1 Tax=Chondromyces apiculatus DSM 436 TaxID=1192034 RepID=A0A017T7Z3_9BACT|nr:non-ribosomal peptide synthetase [Chondromyces apiculatus]EYF05057.1 Long-chain-fatty-acid--CoA ligase [Chondromyces apiculatus DSM 436]